MILKITNDLTVETYGHDLEITSAHGGRIYIDADEIPALSACLQFAQQSAPQPENDG